VGNRRRLRELPEPDLRSPEHAYCGANLERLLSVKRRYDPDDVFGFR